MPINNDFNPVKLLYYNPELLTQCNIINARQCLSWAQSNETFHLLSNDSMIPDSFDSLLYISDFKESNDISALNEVIRQAMLLEGFSEANLKNRSQYVQSIYSDALLVSQDTLQFNALPSKTKFYISDKDLRVGDSVCASGSPN